MTYASLIVEGSRLIGFLTYYKWFIVSFCTLPTNFFYSMSFSEKNVMCSIFGRCEKVNVVKFRLAALNLRSSKKKLAKKKSESTNKNSRKTKAAGKLKYLLLIYRQFY
jgi:hypothetical protein